MKTISINLYSFDELNPAAKEKAIEKERQRKYECSYLLEGFNEDSIYKIINLGFENPEINYSLNNCQGDGLSFKASNYDKEKLIELFKKYLGPNKEKTIDLILNYLSIEIKGNKGNHYCYASKNDIELNFEYYKSEVPNIENIIAAVENDLKDIYMNICYKLEERGYKELEYQFSDECIIEDIQANEHEFTKEGNIY